MNTIMEIKDLNLWYGDHQALHNISVDLPKNEITALIGPSGCGKSTFLKTLNRMQDTVPGVKITGEVLYEGSNIYDPSVDVTWLRKRIGMVFQKANPFPMSIYDNIAYGPRTHGIRSRVKLDEIVEKSLRDAAIWDEVKDRLKSSALGMSGGQQQRLCIARALAVEPDILLMDESTSALDPISTGKIEELAVQLKEKYTVIMVTHNPELAEKYAEKIPVWDVTNELVGTCYRSKLLPYNFEVRAWELANELFYNDYLIINDFQGFFNQFGLS